MIQPGERRGFDFELVLLVSLWADYYCTHHTRVYYNGLHT